MRKRAHHCSQDTQVCDFWRELLTGESPSDDDRPKKLRDIAAQHAAMFRKFEGIQDIRSNTQVKSSVVRDVKKQVTQLYGSTLTAEILSQIFPKKQPVFLVKSLAYVTFVESRGFLWFWRIRTGPWYPTLRLLHKFPDLLPRVRVDRGAIPHVLSGASIMAPGLTSAGGDIPDGLSAGDAVSIMAEGKKLALAVGRLTMSSERILAEKKGIAIDDIMSIGDGIWTHTHPKQETAGESQDAKAKSERKSQAAVDYFGDGGDGADGGAGGGGAEDMFGDDDDGSSGIDIDDDDL